MPRNMNLKLNRLFLAWNNTKSSLILKEERTMDRSVFTSKNIYAFNLKFKCCFLCTTMIQV